MKYRHEKDELDECPISSKTSYLIPVKPTQCSEIITAYFNRFFGGYESFNRKHVQIRKVFNANCLPFSGEQILTTKEVAQALLVTIQSEKSEKEWTNLTEGFNAKKLISSIESSRKKYIKGIETVFPQQNPYSTIVTEEQTISLPKSIQDKIKSGYYFVFRQDLADSSSVVLTTLNYILTQFPIMIQQDKESCSFFKKMELTY